MKLRLLLAAAIALGSIFVGAGPASATCRPERPEPCEVEGFPPDYSCVAEIVLPNGTSYTVDLCDPSRYIPQ